MTYWVDLLYYVEFIDLCRFDMHIFVYKGTHNFEINKIFFTRHNERKKLVSGEYYKINDI